MLEPEQQEEDILVGGVVGMRNRNLNKVRKLYTWRRHGGIEAEKGEEGIPGGKGR